MQFSNYFIQIAKAAPEETHAETAVAHEGAEHSGGLSVEPAVIAFQAVNFVILAVVLTKILYKPLTKLLQEREQRIREGVENAEKAKASLDEATMIRQDMMKRANIESQHIIENARKSSEVLKASILKEAHDEAGNIIKSGHQLVEMEKSKTLEELKGSAVKLIVMAAEKILREKVDPAKDARLIEESLNAYSL
jgi:F-type H+-transporting ATPase subunit b